MVKLFLESAKRLQKMLDLVGNLWYSKKRHREPFLELEWAANHSFSFVSKKCCKDCRYSDNKMRKDVNLVELSAIFSL